MQDAPHGATVAAMLRIIFALLALHIVEIWCYGLTYWGLPQMPDAGFVHGQTACRARHAVRCGLSVSHHLQHGGFGDLAPVGAIRLVSGTESLTGLLLITWSASFTYLEMSRLWRERVD